MTRDPSRIPRTLRLFAGFSVALTCTAILFVAANLVALAPIWVTDPEPPADIREALAEAYPELSPEQHAEIARPSQMIMGLEVVGQYRERPYQSPFVNIDEHGFRRGLDQGPWPPDPKNYNIYFFGGSTAFGKGVRDEDTVPSQLQQALGSVEGRPVKVYNFARGGFYSSQERLLFDELTTLGHRPDAAVFLDGLNEFFFTVDPPRLTITATKQAYDRIENPWSEVLRRLPLLRRFAPEARDLRRLHHAHQAALDSPPSSDDAIKDVIRRYVANKRVIESIGTAHGTRTVFAWQPVPTYVYGRWREARAKGFQGHALSGPGYARMRGYIEKNPLGDEFIWCADIQAGLSGRLYVDSVHYGPTLSKRLAQCVADGFVRAGGDS